MSYKKGKVQCPNCKSKVNGVFEIQNFIRKTVEVDCYICGYKLKIKKENEKSKQKKLI